MKMNSLISTLICLSLVNLFSCSGGGDSSAPVNIDEVKPKTTTLDFNLFTGNGTKLDTREQWDYSQFQDCDLFLKKEFEEGRLSLSKIKDIVMIAPSAKAQDSVVIFQNNLARLSDAQNMINSGCQFQSNAKTIEQKVVDFFQIVLKHNMKALSLMVKPYGLIVDENYALKVSKPLQGDSDIFEGKEDGFYDLTNIFINEFSLLQNDFFKSNVILKDEVKEALNFDYLAVIPKLVLKSREVLRLKKRYGFFSNSFKEGDYTELMISLSLHSHFPNGTGPYSLPDERIIIFTAKKLIEAETNQLNPYQTRDQIEEDNKEDLLAFDFYALINSQIQAFLFDSNYFSSDYYKFNTSNYFGTPMEEVVTISNGDLKISLLKSISKEEIKYCNADQVKASCLDSTEIITFFTTSIENFKEGHLIMALPIDDDGNHCIVSSEDRYNRPVNETHSMFTFNEFFLEVVEKEHQRICL